MCKIDCVICIAVVVNDENDPNRAHDRDWQNSVLHVVLFWIVCVFKVFGDVKHAFLNADPRDV